MTVNFSGAWKANLAKSRFLGPTPRALAVKIVQLDPQLKAQMIVTRPDGNEDRVVFYCQLNGEPDRNLMNGKPVRGSARWEGEELIIESWVQAGAREMHFRDCWSLSADEQTLIMEHRNDDLAGQIAILERTE